MVTTLHSQPGALSLSETRGRLIVALCCLAALSGCADYYGPPPAYAGGGYYAQPAPYYAGPAYGGSVIVDVNDRPYYTRGPGYYVGGAYYVWKPGHWTVRNGRKVWIHGHYVLR